MAKEVSQAVAELGSGDAAAAGAAGAKRDTRGTKRRRLTASGQPSRLGGSKRDSQDVQGHAISAVVLGEEVLTAKERSTLLSRCEPTCCEVITVTTHE